MMFIPDPVLQLQVFFFVVGRVGTEEQLVAAEHDVLLGVVHDLFNVLIGQGMKDFFCFEPLLKLLIELLHQS